MVNLIIPRVLTKATSTTPFYNELLLSVRSSNYSTLFLHIHVICSNGRPPLRRTELRNHSSWCQDWQLSDFITIICITKLKLKCLKNTCKHHRTKSQIPYYSNSIATFQLWLRAGDISENSGPTVKSEWTHPCTKALVCLQCNKCVQRNQKHLFCIKWMDLTHTHCAGVGNTKHLISSLPNEWIKHLSVYSVISAFKEIKNIYFASNGWISLTPTVLEWVTLNTSFHLCQMNGYVPSTLFQYHLLQPKYIRHIRDI